jgi:hypothetical protein
MSGVLSDMTKHVLTAIAVLVLISAGPGVARVGEISLDVYQDGLSPKWEEKSFNGNTRYEAVQEGGTWHIRATSKASASALYYPITYDLQEYPILTWRWKLEEVRLNGQDPSKRSEDCPARIYVVFPAPLIWRSKAVSYTWTNGLPDGEVSPPHCADSLVEITLRSGDHEAGTWVEEKRNVLEDYRKYFGEDPPKVGAIAIMTDTDNTGGDTTTSYGPIRIVSESVW